VGYRWFDQQRLEPLYPFGFGMTYTRFEYSDLRVRGTADHGLEASVLLHNAGALASDEVVQLYLGAPEQAVSGGVQFAARALAGFERVHLTAGESRRITLHVEARALQYWSSNREEWVTASGPREVYVGQSSRDPGLHTITIVPSR
jgi:beta-glucosidase